MMDQFNTTKFKPLSETGNEAHDILLFVYHALQAKGYDPTYITSYNSARSMICRLERDEIMEELVRFYVAGNAPMK